MKNLTRGEVIEEFNNWISKYGREDRFDYAEDWKGLFVISDRCSKYRRLREGQETLSPNPSDKLALELQIKAQEDFEKDLRQGNLRRSVIK